jgi:hypothetical protein
MMPPSRFRSFWPALCALTLTVATPLCAQITFTLRGTVTTASADLGYALNDVVTFSISTDPGFDNFQTSNLFSFSGSTAYNWREAALGGTPAFVFHDNLFSSFTGTGLTGDYSRIGFSGSYLQIYDANSGGTIVRSYAVGIQGSGTQIGTLTGPAGGANAAVSAISLHLEPSSPLTIGAPAVPTVFTHPEITLASLAGTSLATNSTLSLKAAGGGMTTAVVTISDFTVTLGVIPEPSTYAVVVGLAALGFAGWRRRRRV